MKDITIIILTYNSDKTIDACIKSVLNQDYDKNDFDIYVIDNGSSDKTVNIIRSYNLKYYILPNCNISSLRNKGAEYAISKYIGYVDSDCIIDKSWIKNSLSLFTSEDIAIVGYKYLLPDNPSWLESNWYKIKYHNINFKDIIPAGNMIINKIHYNLLGGFNENIITGEDSDILIRARQKQLKTIASPEVKNVHLGNAKNLRDLYHKELWYGMGTNIFNSIINIDRPFYLSNIILISACIMFISILLSDIITFSIFALVVIAILLLSSLDRKYNKNIDGKLISIMIIYLVYFMARIHSLFYVYGLKNKYKYKRKINDKLSVTK